MTNAIVLLGNSGVGKDTMSNMLIAEYPSLVNVKFSGLTKDILAQLFEVPRSWLDEKGWREENIILGDKDTGISPLTLLSTMFLSATDNSNLAKANIDWALNGIPEICTPVFTDVRREVEMRAVLQNFVKVTIVHLTRTSIFPKAVDGAIRQIAKVYGAKEIHSVCGETPKDTYEELKLVLADILPAKVPTLHVWLSDTSITPSLLNYEPLTLVIETLNSYMHKSALCKSGINYHVAQFLSTCINDIDFSIVPLPEITKDCYMIYNKNFHSEVIKRLRGKVNIQLHISSSQYLHQFPEFTLKELDNAKID